MLTHAFQSWFLHMFLAMDCWVWINTTECGPYAISCFRRHSKSRANGETRSIGGDIDEECQHAGGGKTTATTSLPPVPLES